MKKTIVMLSENFLEELLHIPPGVEIENVSMDRFSNGHIRILLSGDGLPDFTELKVGDLICQSEIIYTKTITNEFKKVG